MRAGLVAAMLIGALTVPAAYGQESRTPASDPWSPDLTVTTRLGTDSPAETAIEISQVRFIDGAASHVVLSRTDDFPDALAASPLLGDGPLLLTPTERLDRGVRTELERVLPAGGRVYVLGGAAAMSHAVENEVIDAGYDVKRLWGNSRLDTAAAVAREVARLYPDSAGDVLLARAWGAADDATSGWADAVAVGAFAAWSHHPVLLSATDSMSVQVADYLDEDHTVTFIGGEAALSQHVRDQVRAITGSTQGVVGPDRDATAHGIMAFLWGHRAGQGRVTLVNGWDEAGWALGLSAAGLAGDFEAPVLLVGRDFVPLSAGYALTSCDTPNVQTLIVGTTTQVTDDVARAVEARDGAPCE